MRNSYASNIDQVTAAILNEYTVRQNWISNFSSWIFSERAASATPNRILFSLSCFAITDWSTTFLTHLRRRLIPARCRADLYNLVKDWKNPIRDTEEYRDSILEILSDARVVAPVIQMADLHSSIRQRSYFYVFAHQTTNGDYPQVMS